MTTSLPLTLEMLAKALRATARADRLLITVGGEVYNFRADKIRLAVKAWKGAAVTLEKLEHGGRLGFWCLAFRRGTGVLKLYEGTAVSKIEKRNGCRRVSSKRTIVPERPASIVLSPAALVA
jgi:hypothetical protein